MLSRRLADSLRCTTNSGNHYKNKLIQEQAQVGLFEVPFLYDFEAEPLLALK
jgi:hypothetical protein